MVIYFLVDGTLLLLLLDGSTEIYPIISSGLHAESEGLGFNIFYNEKNELSAIVKTNSTIYSVTHTPTVVPNDTIRSFIVTWTPEMLKLFEGNSLLQSDVGTIYDNNMNNTRIFDQEHILIFSQYHFGSFSYSYGEFLNFKIWRYALDENKDKSPFGDGVTRKL